MIFLYFHSLIRQHNCLAAEEVINTKCHKVPLCLCSGSAFLWGCEWEQGCVCPLHSLYRDDQVLISRYLSPDPRSIFKWKRAMEAQMGSRQIIFSAWEVLSFAGRFRQDVPLLSSLPAAYFSSSLKRTHIEMFPSPPCPLLTFSPLN